MSSGRFGLLVGIAVVVTAVALIAITTSTVPWLIMTWVGLVALVGWVVFAVYERLRRRTD